MQTTYTAETWPISTVIGGFSPVTADGVPMNDAPESVWRTVFEEIKGEGLDNVEIGDGWIKPALLSAARLDELRTAATESGLGIPAVHIQRVSVIDPVHGDENLAYQHRSVDAVAALGAEIYSMGLHQPFSDAQKKALWFWTAQGPTDPDDPEVFALAVARIREIGEHAASVGLQVSLELYEDTYLGSADSAVRLVESVGLDNVGLNPDVGNLVRLHRPVEDWREAYAKTLPYANYWHLKNYTRDEAADGSFFTSAPSTLRDGLIDYRAVVKMAIDSGYNGPMTCEQYGGDVTSVCAENARHLRHLLAVALR